MIQPGDHIKVRRVLPAGLAFEHHGIVVGPDEVVHFSGVSLARKHEATIRRATLGEFADGGTIEVVEYAEFFSAADVVARATEQLGQSGYKLFSNNCEHFAAWAKSGRLVSDQVERAAGVARGTGAAVAGSLLGPVGVTALGAGASVSGGAGIMKGLAILGGPATAMTALAAAPAALTVRTMHRVFADDERLATDERDARRRARDGLTLAALFGTGASVATVYGLGVTGLSAVGTTTGLATLGSVIGGGMAAGIGIVAAAPAALTVIAAFALYRFAKRRRSG